MKVEPWPRAAVVAAACGRRCLAKTRLFATLLNLMAFAVIPAQADTNDIQPGGVLRLDLAEGPTIDQQIFGQFLERGDEKEPGPESALLPGTNRLAPKVLERIRQSPPPLLRFPGGGRVEYGGPWTDLIGAERKEGNRFGFPEFLQLCREVGSEPLLVVSMSRHLLPGRNLTVEQSASAAAALVAYCNAPLDAPNSEVRQWAAKRAADGHPEPFRVRLWQIGNEPFWVFREEMRKAEVPVAEWPDRYVDLVEKHVGAMRAVDPSIKVIVEAQVEREEVRGGLPSIRVIEKLTEKLPGRIDFFSWHIYSTWEIKVALRDGKPVPWRTLTRRDWDLAIASAPFIDPATGQSRWHEPAFDRIRATGIPMAVTEWNLNLFARDGSTLQAVPLFLRGIGAASILHALLRHADLIPLAAQSMYIGSEWDIAGLFIPDPATPDNYQVRPTLDVTEFYARHAGERLAVGNFQAAEFYDQPWEITDLPASPRVAWLDVLSTRSPDGWRIFVINRDPENSRTLQMEGSSARPLHRISLLSDQSGRAAREETAALDGSSAINVPPASISVIYAAP